MNPIHLRRRTLGAAALAIAAGASFATQAADRPEIRAQAPALQGDARPQAASQAAPPVRHPRRFEELDANGDGNISRSEFEAARERARERHAQAVERGEATKNGVKMTPEARHALRDEVRAGAAKPAPSAAPAPSTAR